MARSNTYHPFFRPLWRRVALVAVCAGWAGFEAYMGNGTWAMIVAGISAYAAWAYLIDWKEPDQESKSGGGEN
ncbi:hypothetical protein [Roseibium suaedae]|uniref:DUF3329 domain-containing protein n=1 Tax=Roseibium suaedae TaxID=735517 RepID=A0A1M7H9W7_9HYPH|nr:hypothetical protein [Roseibium suaedae]SHM25392.1 hypothetical protein SAMN05444272_2157 [Roseibium suaedae]